jgi:hypothetical protein
MNYANAAPYYTIMYMATFMPWSFDITNIASNFTVCYGKDLALCMSFLHASHYKYYDEQHLLSNLMMLYEESLFDMNTDFCSATSYKTLQILTKHYLHRPFAHKVMVYAEKIDTESKDIAYIKCDPLSSYKQKEFVKYYNDKLQLNLDLKKDYRWVKNLDDLSFAKILHDIGCDYINHNMHNPIAVDDPWVRMRKLQYQSSARYKQIYKHFELWARENTPDSACLSWYLDKLQVDLSMDNA